MTTKIARLRAALAKVVRPSKQDKQAYYANAEVVADYDQWRFGSAGGRYVDRIERDHVIACLADVDRQTPILDMPCGTGRLCRSLLQAGFTDITAADFSQPMLDATAKLGAVKTSREDAFATTFAAGQFGAICCLRFVFHTAEPRQLLTEWRRLLQPGGTVVFDTLLWTPRGLVPPIDRALGGGLYPYREPQLRAWASELGFDVVSCDRILALPSLAYRWVPGPLVAPLAWAEARIPRALFTKGVLCLRKR